MYREHDGVVLLKNLEGSRVFAHGRGKLELIAGKPGVAEGTHGAIVALPNQKEFLVELFDSQGDTIGLAEMSAAEVRPTTDADDPDQVGSETR